MIEIEAANVESRHLLSEVHKIIEEVANNKKIDIESIKESKYSRGMKKIFLSN